MSIESKLVMDIEVFGGGGKGKVSSSPDIQLILLSKAELSSSSMMEALLSTCSSSSPTLESTLTSQSTDLCPYIDSLSTAHFLDKLFLTALRKRVPPAPRLIFSCSSQSDSLTRPQVVLVRGNLAVAVGLFLIVPPAGKSVSKPPCPPLSLRHPELEEDLDEREKERRRLKLRSSVPCGVRGETCLSTIASTSIVLLRLLD